MSSAAVALTFLLLILLRSFYQAEGVLCYSCLDIKTGPCFNVNNHTSTENCKENQKCFALLAKVGSTDVDKAERGCTLAEDDVCQRMLPENLRTVIKCSMCQKDYCNAMSKETRSDVRFVLFLFSCILTLVFN